MSADLEQQLARARHNAKTWRKERDREIGWRHEAEDRLAAVVALIERDHRPIECNNARCSVGLHCAACEEYCAGTRHWPCDYARAIDST